MKKSFRTTEIPSIISRKSAHTLFDQNFLNHYWNEQDDTIDMFSVILPFGGFLLAKPSLNDNFVSLTKRFRDYKFTDLLMIVDKVVMTRYIVPLQDKVPDHTRIIPFPYNVQDCCRLKYTYSTVLPSNMNGTLSGLRSKCVTPKMRFVIKEVFHTSKYAHFNANEIIKDLINLNQPKSNRSFEKNLFVAPERMLDPKKSFNVYYEMSFRVRRWLRCEFASYNSTTAPKWPVL